MKIREVCLTDNCLDCRLLGYYIRVRLLKFQGKFSYFFLKKRRIFPPNCRIIIAVGKKKVIVWLFGRRYILKTLALRRTDKQGSSSRLKVCNFSDVVRNPVLAELEDSELALGCVLLLILI